MSCVPTTFKLLCLWCSMRFLELKVCGWVEHAMADTPAIACGSGGCDVVL